MPYDNCVLIGRFQPFHNEHLRLIKKSLEEAKKVIILLGSYKAAPNFRNPWTFSERVTMIQDALPEDILKRVSFVPIRDYLYNDNRWIAQVQHKVKEAVKHGESVCLGGTEKDATSYYLKLFPQWRKVGTCLINPLNATDIRHSYFSGGDEWRNMVPSQTATYLEEFMAEDRYKNIAEEREFVRGYKKLWEAAPFPPTFVTTDVMVEQGGHVLVIKRGHNPGKGLFALPGGFINQGESIQASALRELYEETHITLPKGLVEDSIKECRVFDHPLRSLRGRTITHAYHIKLEDRDLPNVKAGDDAAEAHWLSLSDLAEYEDRFFEDHLHIINHFVSKE